MMDKYRKINVFKGISSETLEKLVKIGNIIEFKKGEILFMEREEVNHIYIILKGKTSMYKYGQKGQKRVVYILGEGEVINEVIFDKLPSSITCEAFEKSIILKFDVDQLVEVMKVDFVLTKNILNSTGRKVRRLYRQIKNSIPIGLDKKIAAKLWKLSRDYGIDCYTRNLACRRKSDECKCFTKLNIKITVTYLAEMLGSSRETISRELKKLEGLGLIKWEGRTIFVKREEIREFYRN